MTKKMENKIIVRAQSRTFIKGLLEAADKSAFLEA